MTNKKCSICKGKIDSQMGWHGGHNAEPINSGRCCSNCNNNYDNDNDNGNCNNDHNRGNHPPTLR